MAVNHIGDLPARSRSLRFQNPFCYVPGIRRVNIAQAPIVLFATGDRRAEILIKLLGALVERPCGPTWGGSSTEVSSLGRLNAKASGTPFHDPSCRLVDHRLVFGVDVHAFDTTLPRRVFPELAPELVGSVSIQDRLPHRSTGRTAAWFQSKLTEFAALPNAADGAGIPDST